MCSTKSLLAGDGEIIAQIYKERVTKRGYGSGAWGWQTAYREDDRDLTGRTHAAAWISAPPFRHQELMKLGRQRGGMPMLGILAKLLAQARFIAGALALAFIVAIAAPAIGAAAVARSIRPQVR